MRKTATDAADPYGLPLLLAEPENDITTVSSFGVGGLTNVPGQQAKHGTQESTENTSDIASMPLT